MWMRTSFLWATALRRRNTTGTTTKGVDVRGKVLLMLVNEPPSDDPKFFKGKALTYYGRWTYKYEEAARKGAVGVILIHQTQMASYPWEVVRNSNSGEKSYLKLEGPALKVASWVQLDVAKRLASASGMDLDKMMQDAQIAGVSSGESGAKLQGAHGEQGSAISNRITWWRCCRARIASWPMKR